MFEDEIKHHWAISQKLMENQPWLKPIGNQTWNIKRFGSQASHMRWGHGKGFPSLGLDPIPFYKLAYPVMGTPTWMKLSTFSSGMRGFENYKRVD